MLCCFCSTLHNTTSSSLKISQGITNHPSIEVVPLDLRIWFIASLFHLGRSELARWCVLILLNLLTDWLNCRRHIERQKNHIICSLTLSKVCLELRLVDELQNLLQVLLILIDCSSLVYKFGSFWLWTMGYVALHLVFMISSILIGKFK